MTTADPGVTRRAGNDESEERGAMSETCTCPEDDPCFCFPELAHPEPRYKVRPSAEFVQQVRTIGGDHRWPLRATPTPPSGGPR